MGVLSYLVPFLAVLASVSSSPIGNTELSLAKRQNAPNVWRPYPVRRNSAYLTPQPLETEDQHILEITTYYMANGKKGKYCDISLSPMEADLWNNRNLNIRFFGVENPLDGQVQLSTQKNGAFKNKKKIPDTQGLPVHPGNSFGSATATTRWRRVVIIIRYKADSTAPKGGYYLVRFLGDPETTNCQEIRYDFPPDMAQQSRWISYTSSHEEILSEELAVRYIGPGASSLRDPCTSTAHN
ncbi:hypothetical protein TWF281_007806 [Arthrobotrys megalospora]